MLYINVAGIVLSILYILYLFDIVRPEFFKLFAIYVSAVSLLLILDKLTKLIK